MYSYALPCMRLLRVTYQVSRTAHTGARRMPKACDRELPLARGGRMQITQF
jgi:hypothetical protein